MASAKCIKKMRRGNGFGAMHEKTEPQRKELGAMHEKTEPQRKELGAMH